MHGAAKKAGSAYTKSLLADLQYMERIRRFKDCVGIMLRNSHYLAAANKASTNPDMLIRSCLVAKPGWTWSCLDMAVSQH